MRKELATTEWKIEPVGHVTQWAKNANEETIAREEDLGEATAKAWSVHKIPGCEEGPKSVCRLLIQGGCKS